MINSSLASLALMLIVCSSMTNAWGGLFNRFNPSMLNNFGYGGSYGKELFSVSDGRNKNSVPSVVEEVLKEEAAEEAAAAEAAQAADPCSGKKCTANEHCCDGHVCVDTEETMGICLPIWGKKQGETCYRDNDCESGFVCLESGSGSRVCQAPIPGEAGLGEDCRTSSDCNISRGLCCKLQRRPRSQPKKICTYFSDPSMCLGPVATSQVMSSVEHTAGEKRISGHPDDFLRLK